MQRSSIENSWRLGGSLRSRRSGHGQRGTASTREVKLKKTMREAAGRVPTYGKMMTPGILHQILMRRSRDLAEAAELVNGSPRCDQRPVFGVHPLSMIPYRSYGGNSPVAIKTHWNVEIPHEKPWFRLGGV